MDLENILVVDDEEAIREVVSTMLESKGYHCTAVSNGRAAQDQVKRVAPDLVLSDMIMPEMDGVTALRFIRQKTPGVKVLVASGYTSPEKTPLLEALGIEGFVQKPFELSKLAATVRDVLDGVAV